MVECWIYAAQVLRTQTNCELSWYFCTDIAMKVKWSKLDRRSCNGWFLHRSIYLNSCQNMSVWFSKKGRKGAKKSSSTLGCLGAAFNFPSRLARKSEEATWTIMDGSGSPRRAWNSLRIHGSIRWTSLPFTKLFPDAFWKDQKVKRNLWERKIIDITRECYHTPPLFEELKTDRPIWF